MFSSQAARDDFKIAAQILTNSINTARANKGLPTLAMEEIIAQFKLTQSTLRVEQAINITNALYSFPVATTQQGTNLPFNTEVRLQQTDTFVPTQIFVGWGNPGSSTDAAYKVSSYPSPILFPTGFAAMQTLYNGQLKLQINNYQYMYGWDLDRHYCANQTQQTAALGAGSPADQRDGSSDGYYPLQPFVLFNGLQNVQLQLVLPAAFTAVDANARIVIFLRGVIAQNSTNAV